MTFLISLKGGLTVSETRLQQIKRNQKERFDRRKNEPKRPTKITFPPTKYPSKLHKKLEKIDKEYDKSQKCPLRLARLLKKAISIDKKLQKEKRRINL